MVGVEGLVTSTSQRIADYSQISYQVYCLNIAHACIIFVIGDTILADRGFNIQESVGLFCATVKIPAFTRGKKQLSGIEVEQTRSLANVRIHEFTKPAMQLQWASNIWPSFFATIHGMSGLWASFWEWFTLPATNLLSPTFFTSTHLTHPFTKFL